MDNALVEFQEFSPEKISGMVDEYMKLTVPEADTGAYKAARAALTTCVSTRTGIDRRRKELGEDARAWINKVNSTAKELTELLTPAEQHLRAELDREDARKQKIKEEKERLERERIDGIRRKISQIQSMTTNLNGLNSAQLEDLATQVAAIEITVGDYQELIGEADSIKKTAAQAIDSAIEARVKFEAEQKELEEKRKALAEEEARQKAKLAEERAKLQKEKEEFDRREAERLAREAEERTAAEARARKEREAQLLPDKEKITAWLNQFISIAPPEVSNDASREFIESFVKSMAYLVNTSKKSLGEI